MPTSSPNPISIDTLTLCWLAGLLEGEGSFAYSTASYRPTVTVNMIDKDVIERVSLLFSLRYTHIAAQKEQWKPSYLVRIRDAKAVDLMRLIYPIMGSRRQRQIQEATENYVDKPHHRDRFTSTAKLNEAQVRLIKQRIANGETAKEIAPDFGVTHYTIWGIKSGKTWDYVSLDEAVVSKPDTAKHDSLALDDELKTLHWLAGLLEGEGSFKAGPPSSPNSPSISMTSTDEDIIQQVSEIFGVKYFVDRAKLGGHYKTPYVVHLRSAPAYELMQRFYPLMGQRRQAQIDRALENYVYDPLRKVTEEQVYEIKRRLAAGAKLIDISRSMGVSYAIVK